MDATAGEVAAAADRLVSRQPTIEKDLAGCSVSAYGRMVAESTLTTILRRMASCSGKRVAWELAVASDET